MRITHSGAANPTVCRAVREQTRERNCGELALHAYLKGRHHQLQPMTAIQAHGASVDQCPVFFLFFFNEAPNTDSYVR